jgi:hypothetical protein
MTAFLAIILPVLVVVGAFTWLQPSKRDQQLAKLRSDALVSGFQISSLKVLDLSEHGRINNQKRIVTVYQKPLAAEKKDDPIRYTVLRTSGESGAYLPEGWAWETREQMTEADYERLNALLATLPESVDVVNLDRTTVSLSWDEKDQNINFEVLTRWLESAATGFNRSIHGV